MKLNRYDDPNRLGEVMALIQVLAVGRLAIRDEKKLKEQLWDQPTSKAATWTDLAENHREFFHVHRPDGKHSEGNISLILRHAIPAESKEELNEGRRPPLSSELVTKLIEIAVSLHDREIARKQRLAYLIPLGVVIIAGLFKMFGF